MNTQVKANNSTYTKLQLGSLALRAICTECVRTNTPLTRAEINTGVEDVVISVQVMNKYRGYTMSKSEIRDRIATLAETWVG